MDEAGALDGPPVVQRLLKSIEDKPGMGGPRHPPADDPLHEAVDDESDVDEALPGRDAGEVGHPGQVGPRGEELPVRAGGRARHAPVRHRRPGR